MKKLVLVFLIFPACLMAQQTGTINSPGTTTNYNLDIAALNNQIASLTNQIKEIGAQIKAVTQQINTLVEMKNGLQSQLANLKKQLDDLEENDTKRAAIEKDIAVLNKKLDEVNKQIAAKQSFIDTQTEEIKKLETTVAQQQDKVKELEARNKAQSKQKGTDLVEEQAEAYAHIRIINDSLPNILAGLSLSEKTVINGFNTKFNNDQTFRTTTLNYIKQANANKYFGTINKAGTAADRTNRFLTAAREELVILSKN